MNSSLTLLRRLISTPSSSRSEDATADILFCELARRGYSPQRLHNNVWAIAPGFDSSKPTVLLNSHHDTVKPASGWTFDPFTPTLSPDGSRLYGLGSNDAGASVVCLIDAFTKMSAESLSYNLVIALTAEEEVGGEHGIRALLPHLEPIGITPSMALVGEPTAMQPAIAERGLVVLDCVAHGVAGHAARGEGVNAIYVAMADIDRLLHFRFPRQSSVLGPIGIAVTQINAGTQHNVVPAECRFVVDVRTTDAYSNADTVAMLDHLLESDVKARSTRVQASVISAGHPLVLAALRSGGQPFVSPTTSDMSLMHGLPSLKMGPGHSSRSHKADEYICLSELSSGTRGYIDLLTHLNTLL